jgi:hypothetical protein
MINMDEKLAARGWTPAPAGEFCSLDCPETTGLVVKRWHHSDILLCTPHARLLQSGYVNHTYAGAPLPAESRATEWPWQRIARRQVAVV